LPISSAHPARHLAELDGIRGLAVMLVIYLHCIGRLDFLPAEIHDGVTHLLVGGVDLFFVLSGFLIGGIVLDNRHSSNFFRVFWARRAGRILPVYLVLLCSYAAVLALSPFVQAIWWQGWILHEPLMPFWSYLTFTQNYFMAAANDTGALWIGVTWSLAIEEQFYLVFPILVLLLPRRVMVAIALVALIVSPIVRGYLQQYGNYAAYFPTPARWDSLMFGFLTACVGRNDTWLAFFTRFVRWCDVGAVVIIGVLLAGWLDKYNEIYIYTATDLLFGHMVLRIYSGPNGLYRWLLRLPVLTFAGTISYAWYMYHQAINGLLHGLILNDYPQSGSVSQLAVSVLVVGCSAALAALSTACFERPFKDWAHTARYRLPLAVPVTAKPTV
jgi:peptidoglycan/LPS O-acetylase OafA/YrhL